MAQDGQLFAFDLQGRYSEEDGHIVDAHSACSECHISWVSYIPYPLSTGQGMCYISEVAYPCNIRFGKSFYMAEASNFPSGGAP